MHQRRPGTILQLLLAGGSYKDRKFQTGELSMIGAMPAVAVRHERRRQEKRTKRPSLLYLQSPPSRSPTPSPLQSPPSVTCSQPPPEVYVCGKISVLHIVVVSLLLGAVLLIVGLVQLNPKADATQHRFLLLGTGAFLTLFGIILGMVRCCVLPWAVRKRHHHRHHKDDLENGKPRTSLDAVALDQDLHNKIAATAGTAKSNATPRSSVTSSTIPPRASSASILSPSEHEALINHHRNRKDLENGKPHTSLDRVAHDQNSQNKSSIIVTPKSVSTPRSSLTSSTIPLRPSNLAAVPAENEALISKANNADSETIDT